MPSELVIAFIGLLGVMATAIIADWRAAKKSALDELSCLVDNLQEDVAMLRAENKELRERIVALEKENALLKQRVSELERENNILQHENARLRGSQ